MYHPSWFQDYLVLLGHVVAHLNLLGLLCPVEMYPALRHYGSYDEGPQSSLARPARVNRAKMWPILNGVQSCIAPDFVAL
jgi:hypothetical protein